MSKIQEIIHNIMTTDNLTDDLLHEAHIESNKRYLEIVQSLPKEFQCEETIKILESEVQEPFSVCFSCMGPVCEYLMKLSNLPLPLNVRDDLDILHEGHLQFVIDSLQESDENLVSEKEEADSK